MPTGLTHIQYGTDYPLVDPPDEIKDFIVDMTVSYTNPKWEYDLPLRITWLDQTDIQLKNAGNSVIFDSRVTSCAKRKNAWGGAYTVWEWIGSSVVVKMVTRNDRTIRYGAFNASIDIRAVWCAPKHLLSINGYKGDIVINAGYNADLDIANNSLTIGAVAGAGKGKTSSECSTPKTNGIKSINGVYPDDTGRINIDADEGYHLSIDCNKLKLANSDDPCCPCSSYEEFTEYLNKVADAYRILGGKARWLYEQQSCIAETWHNTVLKPRAEAIHITMTPGPCPYFIFRIQITNIHKVPMSFVSFEGKFNLPTKKISEIRTSMETVSGELSVLVDDELLNVGAEYTRVKHDYERHIAKGDHLTCEFEGCIEPGDSVFYEADMMLDGGDADPGSWPERREYTVAFHLTEIEADYHDGKVAKRQYKNVKDGEKSDDIYANRRGTESDMLHNENYTLLSGNYWRDTVINCDEEIQDPVTNKDKAEDIKDGIYELKRQLWPCED